MEEGRRGGRKEIKKANAEHRSVTGNDFSNKGAKMRRQNNCRVGSCRK